MATTYSSWEECLVAQPQLNKALLRLAKLKKADGMPDNGTRIYWDKFEPWLTVNIEQLQKEVVAGDGKSIDELKKETLMLENTERRLDIKKKEGKYLEPEDVKIFLAGVGNAIAVILNNHFSQLAPSLTGKSTAEIDLELKKVASEVFTTFKKDMRKFVTDVSRDIKE